MFFLFYSTLSKQFLFGGAGEERGEWNPGDDEGVHGQGGGVLHLPAPLTILLPGILAAVCV